MKGLEDETECQYFIDSKTNRPGGKIRGCKNNYSLSRQSNTLLVELLKSVEWAK